MRDPRKIIEGRFIKRPNRFLAIVEINNQIVEAFLPNPGRMHEFMIPGKTVYLRENVSKKRKTNYDMIGVLHDGLLVSIDSNLPNRHIRRLLENHTLPFFSRYEQVIPEPRYSEGRFDFKLEGDKETTLIEVKSCTLVEDGLALFPDAPTVRGTRHMKHLAETLAKGDVQKAAVIFVIQRPDASHFSPHDSNDPHFGDALRLAFNSGVEIIPLTHYVVGWNLELKERIHFVPGPLNLIRS